MRRKSPVQQWVDSIPRKDQQAVRRATSQDDISVTEGGVSGLLSPIKKLEIKSASTPVPLYTNTSFTPDKDKSDISNLCDIDSSAQQKEPNRNVQLELYSRSVDTGLLKRSSKGSLLRERSTNSEGNSPRHKNALFRDSSLQSEGATSRCSSVESLLESRRVDAEAVLRGVGFGPSPARQQLARIPDRFLKPSQVKGVNTEQFIRDEQRSMKMHECGVFGYRGLTGHPHSPPSSIVAKIIERISSRDDLPDASFYPVTPRLSDIDTF